MSDIGESPRTVDEVTWETFKFTEDAVLCFIFNKPDVMLIHKKTGLGIGKVNAPGGRIDPGETAYQAAVREVHEEIGLSVTDLHQVAELNFIFTNGYSLRGFVFFTDHFSGTPISTREADPFWCAIDKIPYNEMWEDDQYWLPHVLAGEKVCGRFIFDEDRMLSKKITQVSQNPADTLNG